MHGPPPITFMPACLGQFDGRQAFGPRLHPNVPDTQSQGLGNFISSLPVEFSLIQPFAFGPAHGQQQAAGGFQLVE